MICPYCGTEIIEDLTYCPFCGEDLTVEGSPFEDIVVNDSLYNRYLQGELDKETLEEVAAAENSKFDVILNTENTEVPEATNHSEESPLSALWAVFFCIVAVIVFVAIHG